MKSAFRGVAALAIAAAASPALAEPPAAGAAAQRRAFYGELHLHTSYSMDAVILGGTLTTLDEAYRFARGDAVSWHGQELRRAEPLDFIAITDHAEQMGVGREIWEPQSPIGRSELAQRFRARLGATTDELRALFRSKDPIPGVDTRPTIRSAWQRQVEAVRRYYQPGRFTTLVGYEWSATPDQQNLHRNVIFRGTEVPDPFSAADSERPEDLWSYLESARARGIEVLAIPHNANVSNGLMYDGNGSDGRPLDAETARRRARNEPLTEIAQTKGASETHPLLSPNDEFASFELFETLFSGKQGRVSGSYVREAWGLGLVLSQRIGVNPYRSGVVGATDLHNGLSDTREDTYRGPNGAGAQDEDAVKKLLGITRDPASPISTLATGSGALTGVWAEENTREAIYDALRRQETFATSGPRILVRSFGGWDFDASLLGDPDWVEVATARGAPMGGDLPPRPGGAAAPRFVVWALRDPRGANLERVQMIKVWLDGGRSAERIFDLCLSDGREADPKTGQAPPLAAGKGKAADAAAHTVGAAELAAIWRDPDFDPAEPALYYVRVLEVPTPRWSTLLATERGLPLPTGVPAEIQERAWSSPIWYTPAPGA